jgi:hypothetical protein
VLSGLSKRRNGSEFEDCGFHGVLLCGGVLWCAV